MTFHDFISFSSIVMTPDLKTRPRTDGGRGDDSARDVFNRLFFVATFKKGHIGVYFQIISD